MTSFFYTAGEKPPPLKEKKNVPTYNHEKSIYKGKKKRGGVQHFYIKIIKLFILNINSINFLIVN